MVVREEVEAGVVAEPGEPVRAGVAEVDERDERPADGRRQQRGADALDALIGGGSQHVPVDLLDDAPPVGPLDERLESAEESIDGRPGGERAAAT